LVNMVNFSEMFYREFSIPKRNGSTRNIDAPYPSLYSIQRWILDNILSKIRIHASAFGFVKKRSVVDNAKMHLGKKCLLKMDIKEFFPSINLKRVIPIFLNLNYPQNISYILAKLCCKNGYLPQGSPASPYISNIVAKRLDSRLMAVSKTYFLQYSRYADDLVFSGDYIPHKFIKIVEEILQDEGFLPNKDKTKLIVGQGKKIITGISISNGKLTIPRNMKRTLRKEAHFILLNGLELHSAKINDRDPIYLERLIGKFNFWKCVEPESEYVLKTLNELKKCSSSI